MLTPVVRTGPFGAFDHILNENVSFVFPNLWFVKWIPPSLLYLFKKKNHIQSLK